MEHVVDTFLSPLGWQGQLVDHGGQDPFDVEGTIAPRRQFGRWMSQFKVRAFQPDLLTLREWAELGILITLLGHKVLGV